MANSVPTNHFVDKATVLAQDLARNRQIALNLQQKFAPISNAMWNEHQQALYPDNPEPAAKVRTHLKCDVE